MSALQFETLIESRQCAARVGRVTTPHGVFDTPAFMPVGTQGTVKGLLPGQVAATGSQIILGNTYHLMLRPGADLVHDMGGLQAWTGWPGPVLTDSGGYQVFSLAKIAKVTDAGVTFQSHIDGATVELTPQRSIQVQNQLGADIIMALDDCPPATTCGESSAPESASSDGPRPVERDARRVADACERSIRWLGACITAHERQQDQAMFGIVQGGISLDQRTWCAHAVLQHDLPGYAIGGVAVGEQYSKIKSVVEHTAPQLPADRPRYLMGIGYERDLLMGVRAGIDMFDCVLPTRNGRNAIAFTPTGPIRLKNARFTRDPKPIDEDCDCVVCVGQKSASRKQKVEDSDSEDFPTFRLPFSRSYLRHLFMAGEMLGPILVSIHNLRHFQRFMADVRETIADDDWAGLGRRWPCCVDAHDDRADDQPTQ